MPAPHSLPRITAGLACCWSLLAVACQSPVATRIVGPDGSPMAHVHCGANQGACFRMAGELCPSGYELQPVLSGSAGNFLVRCRAPAAPLLASPYPTPPPLATPLVSPPAGQARAPGATAQSSNTWPPPTEPPLMYPWPPPESSAAVRAAPTIPAAPTRDVDIGY